MSTANDSHKKAMEFAELALLERVRGNLENSISLSEQALDYELAAIEQLEEPIEPTYSVLHRSAGTLALDCNQLRKAERIVAKALSQEPPHEIAEELRDLLEQIHFRRHLELKGIVLKQDEMQVSLSGQGVGYGVASADEFLTRINNSSKLFHRIIERRHQRPFREKGRPQKSLSDPYELFVSVPRAASFSVTLKFGASTGQLHLPLDTSEIVDEFMDLMELLNGSKALEIRERIPDPAYLRNFIGLAKKIAPDGERIRQVGFTTIRSGIQRFVEVTKSASELSALPVLQQRPTVETKFAEVLGTLRYADATQGSSNKIKVIDEEQKSHTVEVPEGMMNDIVRPMWDSIVIIKGLLKGAGKNSYIELQEIEPAETKTE